MKRPRHATVVAYLALFIALGSGAYAATQLPKNSVGAKQLKKNAVTAAKVKDGAVTGAKIGSDAVTGAKVDELTLGKVPSAATADSAATATNAATAADASALNGVPSAGFLQTSDTFFGGANPEILSIQTMINVPGAFSISTVGDGADEFKVRIENLSSASWFFHSRNAALTLPPTLSSPMSAGAGVFQLTIVAYDVTNDAKHAVIQCAGYSGSPGHIFCTAQVSPAA